MTYSTTSSARPNARDFAERCYGIWIGIESDLILAARITWPHFSVSSAMNLPKSAGEPAGAAK
jgi:hypothetical protein